MRSSNRNVTSQHLLRVDHNRIRPSSIQLGSDISSLIYTGGSDNISGVTVRNMDAQYDGVTTDDNRSMVNSKPFLTVRRPRRRRHEHAVFGNGSDDAITSGSKRYSLQVVELSQRLETAVKMLLKPPAPSNGCPIYRFLGKPVKAGDVDTNPGPTSTNKSGFAISAINKYTVYTAIHKVQQD